jgi:hypothetical protein
MHSFSFVVSWYVEFGLSMDGRRLIIGRRSGQHFAAAMKPPQDKAMVSQRFLCLGPAGTVVSLEWE